jgi:hypothetical protein
MTTQLEFCSVEAAATAQAATAITAIAATVWRWGAPGQLSSVPTV